MSHHPTWSHEGGSGVTVTRRDPSPGEGTHPRPLHGKGDPASRGGRFPNSGLKEQGQRARGASPGHVTPSTSVLAPARANSRQTGLTQSLHHSPTCREPGQQTWHTWMSTQAQHHSRMEPLENTKGRKLMVGHLALRPAPLAKPCPVALERGSKPTWEGPAASRKRLFQSSQARVINSWHF